MGELAPPKERVRLSNNFFEDEFLCPCGTCDGGKMSRSFIVKLQAMRTACGFPFVFESGFRCVPHNEAVGGKVNSMHLLGRAVDIVVGKSDYKRGKIISEALRVGLLGWGVNKTTLHIDDRDKLACWHYYK